MNSVQHRAANKKRSLHQAKRSVKPKVKAMCAASGIEFARMELERNGPLVVWDTSGVRHVIAMNEA